MSATLPVQVLRAERWMRNTGREYGGPLEAYGPGP